MAARIIAAVAIASLALAATVAGAATLDRLRAFVKDTQTARTQFTQTVIGRDGRPSASAAGEFLLERPGKFRWTVTRPYKQLIVGDGERLWVYDSELSQVTVKKLEGSLGSSPAALLAGSNEIETFYNLDAKGTKGGLDWLEAFPKTDDTMFSKVRMGFKGNSLEVMELYDHLGQVTEIRFNRIERNPKLPADSFSFTPPKGADVLDDQ